MNTYTITLNFTNGATRNWGEVEADSEKVATAKVREILRSMKALKGMGLASISAKVVR